MIGFLRVHTWRTGTVILGIGALLFVTTGDRSVSCVGPFCFALPVQFGVILAYFTGIGVAACFTLQGTPITPASSRVVRADALLRLVLTIGTASVAFVLASCGIGPTDGLAAVRNMSISIVVVSMALSVSSIEAGVAISLVLLSAGAVWPPREAASAWWSPALLFEQETTIPTAAAMLGLAAIAALVLPAVQARLDQSALRM